MHGNTVVEAGRGALSMVTVACRAFGGAIVRFKSCRLVKQRLHPRAIQNVLEAVAVRYGWVKEDGTGRLP